MYVVASDPGTPAELIRWSPGNEPVVLRRTSTVDLVSEYIASPDHARAFDLVGAVEDRYQL